LWDAMCCRDHSASQHCARRACSCRKKPRAMGWCGGMPGHQGQNISLTNAYYSDLGTPAGDHDGLGKHRGQLGTYSQCRNVDHHQQFVSIAAPATVTRPRVRKQLSQPLLLASTCPPVIHSPSSTRSLWCLASRYLTDTVPGW
jgi:hypothetical protein